MTKKVLLVLIIAALAAGGVFAQTDSGSMAKYTITVDVAPAIAGLLFSPIGSKVSSNLDNVSDIKTSGFSIALQLERQLFSQISAAARFVYGGYNAGFTYEEDHAKATPNIDLTSIAVEGHVRFYPLGDTFFLDGMVGYARFSADLSGSVVALVGSTSVERQAKANESNNYVKLGAKLGWRKTFGNNGGFVFEPSLGYYLGIPLGDDLGTKVTDAISKSIGGYTVKDIADEFKLLEDYIFVGGPRLSLAFGYRF